MKVLVVGCGSIGRRHIDNLTRIGGHELIAYRTRREGVAELAQRYGVRSVFSLEEALAQHPDVAIIANPTSLHVPIALEAVRAGCHVFIEKPLSHSMEGVDELLGMARERQRVVCVAYQWRFHPLLARVKALIDSGAIGRVVSLRAQVGQYLPDWHPWEDYRQGYYARRDLGGGVILTLSHELDYVLWWLGQPEAVTCFAERGGRLEIDTEGLAEMILRFPNGTLASIHMDYYQRTVTRTCHLIGEDGLVEIDLERGVARTFFAARERWEEDTLPAGFAPNQMYLDELEHFLDCVQRDVPCRIDGMAGRLTLQVALAAKQASASGRAVAIDEAVNV